LPKAASSSEKIAYLLDRALCSQGIVSLDSICHLDAPSKVAVAKTDRGAVCGAGELVSVALEGAGKQEALATSATLEETSEGENGLVHILSPFDPLIIQRKRTNLFFGYEHRSRPTCRRKSGSSAIFALPVLVDGRSSPRWISRPTASSESC